MKTAEANSGAIRQHPALRMEQSTSRTDSEIMEEVDLNGDLKRPWDTCREVPIIEDEHTPWKMLKLLKIITLCTVAIMVFGLAICSKVSFLLLITLSHEDTKIISPDLKPVTLLCIGCALIAPSVLLLLKSVWKACYKSSKVPKKASVALVLFFELLVSVGLAILTIVAMPHLDIVTNVTILNGVAVLPTFLQAVAQCTAKKINVSLLPSILGVLAILTAFCIFLVLYILKDLTDVQTATWVGLAVGGCFFVSFNWWENYFMLICVNSKSKFLKSLFEDLTKSQNMLHILSSLLRIVVTACVLGAYVPLANMDWDIVTSIPSRETRIVVITIGIQLISSALCYWFALAAFKMHAIRRCFIIPLYLASLAVMVFYIVPVIVYFEDYKLSLNTTENINFTSYCDVAVNGRNLSLIGNLYPELVLDVTQTLCFLDMSEMVDIGLLTGAAVGWWIGLVMATIHIWYLNVSRIQKTQDLFVRRLYEGAFIEQSLLLNTKFHIQTKKGMKKEYKEDGDIAKVYLCATMWHETYEEIMNIMISIFRLDKYRPKEEEPKFNDFTFEAHIYFDDAFETVEGNQNRQLNSYANDLVKIITEVYGIFTNLDKTLFDIQQTIPDLFIIETPYGARLVVKMPHGNEIIVHFKDKEKIRNKKRWSQVMYLYYLLGWKLMTNYHKEWKKGGKENELIQKLETEKHNTYLLALDGDTDFQPASVMLLIDRLKMYPRVGAACGRIHPTGSGPAVWFQKFEYAVSHWLQKTAEHVFGCVLCSPGCFSLFRGEALMDDNVMKKYSTTSTEPSHYIQYDQGEDRWLCTLLLKQGWRVEYNAASDAYTNAPQDFKELYNQRRRWGPSTMANVVDLLGSTNLVSKKNRSMSKPFMFYQLFAMISAILAPATIVLMVAGSLSFLLEINTGIALVISVIPPAIYLGLCFKLKTDTQITIAAVMSIFYAILMLVVTMSIIGAMVKEKTILTPSSIFIVAMSIIYIVTALMHPQELPLVFYGFLYIICIPSAYLLLTIYSMVNMNCVSWGTREAKPAAGAGTPGTNVQQTQSEKAKNTFKKLCSWMKCCKKPNQGSEVEEISIRQNLDPVGTQLEPQPQNTIIDDVLENEQVQEAAVCETPVQSWKTQLMSLSRDIQLQEGSLDEDEQQFWKELIEKYLKPLKIDKETQERTKTDLQELRNKINFSFFFLNALWVVAAFLFQVFDAFVIEINIVDFNLVETGGKFQVEPMSLMFILGFALSVLLQFLGMFYHRVVTLIHYVAFLETEPKQQKYAHKKHKKQKKSKSIVSSSSASASSAHQSSIAEDQEDETDDERDDDTEVSQLDYGDDFLEEFV